MLHNVEQDYVALQFGAELDPRTKTARRTRCGSGWREPSDDCGFKPEAIDGAKHGLHEHRGL